MSDDRQLLDLYFDGNLTPRQEAELCAWLESNPDHVRSLLEEVQFHQSLSEFARAQVVPEAGFGRFRRRWHVLAAAAGIMICVAGTLLWHAFRPQPMAVMASLAGDVNVSLGPRTEAGRQGMGIGSGAEIECRGPASGAEVAFADGTTIELAENSQASIRTLDGQKQISVARGVLRASVAPQPDGKPLLIRTAQSDLVVLGTILEVRVTGRETVAEVVRGRVRVQRIQDGASIELAAKQELPIGEDRSPLVVRPVYKLDRFTGGGRSGTASERVESVGFDR